MNVAMYLRKSRADENNPLETLERHKEILLSYAKDNNLTVIDIFEEVISGGMLYNRTEMLKLLDAIPSHIYDAVLCIDLDRLGRGSAADSEKVHLTGRERYLHAACGQQKSDPPMKQSVDNPHRSNETTSMRY